MTFEERWFPTEYEAGEFVAYLETAFDECEVRNVRMERMKSGKWVVRWVAVEEEN